MSRLRIPRVAASAALALIVVTAPSAAAHATPAPTAARSQAHVVVERLARPNAHFTHGWVTATIYFNKMETRDATLIAGTVPACMWLAAKAGPAAPALGAACVLGGTAVWVQANRAQHRGMCLKIKLTWPPVLAPTVIWPDIYMDEDCR